MVEVIFDIKLLYEYNFETSHVRFIASEDHSYEFSLRLDKYNGHGP